MGRLEKTTAADLEALGTTLAEKQVELRRAAAAVLAKLGAQAGALWPQIKARLQDEDITVRFQLIRATGALATHQKEAVGTLAQLALKDGHVENRLAAIGELGQLGPVASDAAEALAGIASQDARAAVRDAAAAALKKVRP
jgi:hypothetical protein